MAPHHRAAHPKRDPAEPPKPSRPPRLLPGAPGVTFAVPHGPRLAATQGPRQPPAPGTVLHAPSSRFMPARRHLISGNIMKLKRAGGMPAGGTAGPPLPQPQRGSRAAVLPALPQAETQTYCRASDWLCLRQICGVTSSALR